MPLLTSNNHYDISQHDSSKYIAVYVLYNDLWMANNIYLREINYFGEENVPLVFLSEIMITQNPTVRKLRQIANMKLIFSTNKNTSRNTM